MKRIQWLFSLGLAMALLAGCAQVFPTAQVSELPTAAPTTELPTEEVPAEAPAETENPDVAPTQTEEAAPTTAPPTAAPTEAPSGTTPLGSPELHATNPTNVSLASGKVQLVEFFAFW
jgi:hypothetical protein